jgi:hypothetical protein
LCAIHGQTFANQIKKKLKKKKSIHIFYYDFP